MQTATPTRPYHHGDLRAGLVDAGVELARAEGPEALQLRAVTRAVGVSHNAAYRHFDDHQDLVNAVAERCMAELATLMRAGVATVRVRDRRRRAIAELAAIGRAYIDFAVAEPGWFRTAFAIRAAAEVEAAEVDAAKAAAATSAEERGPYELLIAALDRLVEVGALPSARRPGAEHAAWSAVHGMSMLLVEGPLRDLPPGERDDAITAVLDVVQRGLTGADSG
ncbi:TetR/AcrR family transcriptional regulator [uncultured Jatrophihabitans sp.]|uniref:TetR/AcrR family transcriptional regulator n=1 Tax=uncultured Jatrophihabitans sp. TaxID=1610747 RepID=UPI0035CA1029